MGALYHTSCCLGTTARYIIAARPNEGKNPLYRLGVSVHPASCKKGPLTIEQSNELSFRKPFRVSASVFLLVSVLERLQGV